MDGSIRASDADRDRVTAQLRDHFAAGRITPGELDERLSAALNAKTFGDLRGSWLTCPGLSQCRPVRRHPYCGPRRPGPSAAARPSRR